MKELFVEDQDDDSIPLADDDPRDVLDESFISEEKKRVRNQETIFIGEMRLISRKWNGGRK